MGAFSENLAFLYQLRNRGTKFGLDRMQILSSLMGSPDLKVPSIHIAGTNGKGSVCAMLESIYRKNGYRTGLFTSPHLVSICERIRINYQPISEIELVQGIQEIRKKINHLEETEDYPSFFEMITVLGFYYFAKKKCDIVICETGLGGRLDATNILKPIATAIVSIGMDHTEILGDTLQKIAAEKAGIIKPATPIFCGDISAEALSVLSSTAQRKKAPIYFWDSQNTNQSYPRCSLAGTVQRKNAQLAKTMVQNLQQHFSTKPSLVQSALRKVQWDGRWEKISYKNLKIVLDCTHNTAGLSALQDNLESWIRDMKQKPNIMVGVIGQDRSTSIMPFLSRYARNFYLVAPQQPRAIKPIELKSFISEPFDGKTVFTTPKDFFLNNLGSGIPLLITGSIYLIGEVKSILLQQKAFGWQDLRK